MTNLQPVHLFAKRVGLIEWDVLISEQHTSTEAFTEYPVESGAPINDHHFKQNDTLTITMAHSAAPFSAFEVAESDISTRMGFIWDQLRTAQKSAELFEVGTALELYQNMAIVSLTCTRDKSSATVSTIVISFREVIVVDINETTRFVERFSDAGGIRGRASKTINKGNVSTEDITGTVEDKDNRTPLFKIAEQAGKSIGGLF